MIFFRRKRNVNKKHSRKKIIDHEIAPDEIFLDASNLPKFNRAQFEGRFEKSISHSTFVGLFVFVGVLFLILLLRAGYLQVVRGNVFAQESAHNSLEAKTLFAPRGIITDEHGVVLAENRRRSDGSVRRYYTLPAIGQIIGYVSSPKKDSHGRYYDTAEVGLAGLEAKYNQLLIGKNGKILTERDALGNIRSQGIVVPVKEGAPLVLTIDASLERDFAKAVANVAKREHFVAGAGVIMDVRTGAVRAIVSYPSYNPNVMVNGGPASDIASYNTDEGHPFLDHAVQGVYTPGSTVKPFVASGALTDGIITKDTVIDDKGRLLIPNPYHPGKNYVYNGWRALGPVNVEKAIAWSSDIFFYTVGGGFKNMKGLGIDRLDYWYRQFGLGERTGIDLPNEASGVIPSPAWKEKVFGAPWYLGDTYFTAIGQYGMQVTPIQMARATAAVANGGTLVTPYLHEGDTTAKTQVPVDLKKLSIVRKGMRMGVTSALAGALNFPYVAIAAKTGTAQVGVHNEYDNAWVEGFFPYDNPRYSFAVVLERGPSGAGEQAVNVMHDLFEMLHRENSVYVGGTGKVIVATSTVSKR
ncbi:Cell division protein FtsI [Peptidoglycan synthetase] [hydrothermal vent metagenome]|uniref:Cell division protein FtsI [Peptidoglycan synthetase] n=1 Tax=hydrothermal vent metagenome TaxID=652676 RepID=A0A3B0UPB8_9ZZZZ